MLDTFVYETLDEVHEAFVCWESDVDAEAFGIALWLTAEKHVVKYHSRQNGQMLFF